MNLLAVVVNYRTPELTERALDALLDALPAGVEACVAVVDNASGDGSAERLERFVAGRDPTGRTQLVRTDHNGGFGFGINQAVRWALDRGFRPDQVYLLNSDARPAPDAVRVLVDFLAAHPRAGIAGSYIHGPDGETHRTAFRFPSALSQLEQALGLGIASRLLDRWVVSKPVPTRASRIDWVAGASMMIRFEVIESVGLFDETFFLYFEETDFCRRAAAQGWETWYLPESRVEHVGSASTGWKDTSRPRPAFWFESRRYYFRKHHGRLGLWAANGLWLAGHLAWRLRAALTRRPNPYPPRFLADFLRHNFTFRALPEASRAGVRRGADRP